MYGSGHCMVYSTGLKLGCQCKALRAITWTAWFLVLLRVGNSHSLIRMCFSLLLEIVVYRFYRVRRFSNSFNLFLYLNFTSWYMHSIRHVLMLKANNPMSCASIYSVFTSWTCTNIIQVLALLNICCIVYIAGTCQTWANKSSSVRV